MTIDPSSASHVEVHASGTTVGLHPKQERTMHHYINENMIATHINNTNNDGKITEMSQFRKSIQQKWEEKGSGRS